MTGTTKPYKGLIYILICLHYLFFTTNNVNGQSTCSATSNKIFSEDFGITPSNQKHSECLAPGLTNYTCYKKNASELPPTDNSYPESSYTVLSEVTKFSTGSTTTNTAGASTTSWMEFTEDHTSDDTNGAMILVNSSLENAIFYQKEITGLCAGLEYEFSYYIANAQAIIDTQTYPEISTTISDRTGKIITKITSGKVAPKNSSDPTKWNLVKGSFIVPEGANSVIIKMNSLPSTKEGNVFIVDDIALAICGQEISITPSSITTCIGQNLNITSTAAENMFYQWQYSRDNGSTWSNLSNTTKNLTINNIQSTNSGLYRQLVAKTNSLLTNENCRYISNEASIIVTEPAVASIKSGINYYCIGNEEVVLIASPSNGKSYQWYKNNVIISGANKSEYKFIADNSSKSGSYHFEIINDGCKSKSNNLDITVGNIQAPTIEGQGNGAVFCIPNGGSKILQIDGDYQQYKWIKTANLELISDQKTANITSSGSYFVEVSNGNCSETMSFSVTASGNQYSLTSALNCTSPYGVTLTIQGENIAEIQWFKDDIQQTVTDISYSTNVPGSYYAKVKSVGSSCYFQTTKARIDQEDILTQNVLLSVNSANPTVCGSGGVESQNARMTVSPTANNDIYEWFYNENNLPFTEYWNWTKINGDPRWQNTNAITNTTTTVNALYAGSYYVKIGKKIDGIGVVYCKSNEMRIGSSEPPPSNISGPPSLCTSGAITLSGPSSANDPLGPYRYEWRKTDLSSTVIGTEQTITINTEGVYWLTVKNVIGCISSSNITIALGKEYKPIVTPINPEVSCKPILLKIANPLSAPTEYDWFNGTTKVGTGISYNASVSGNYKAVPKNMQCYLESDVVTVTINPPADATITPAGPLNICTKNGTDADIPELSVAEQPNATYEWYKNMIYITGANTSKYKPTSSGQYFAIVKVPGGCQSISPVVSVNTSIGPNVQIASTTNGICEGEEVDLIASYIDNVEYKWYKDGVFTGSTDRIYTVTEDAEYMVEARYVPTTPQSCVSSDIMAITVNPTSNLTLLPINPSPLCPGGSVDLFITGGSVGYTYEWYKNGTLIPGATGNTYLARLPGVYKAKGWGTGLPRCEATTNEVLVEISNADRPFLITSQDPKTICEGETLTISIEGGLKPNNTYMWWSTPDLSTSFTEIAGSDNALSLDVTNTGYYKVMATPTSGSCTGTSNIIEAKFNATPIAEISITNNDPCSSSLLTAINSDPVNSLYQWYKNDIAIPGATTNTFNANEAGFYKVKVSNKTGTCFAFSNATEIINYKVDKPHIYTTDNSICPGVQTTISINNFNNTPDYSYQWKRDGVDINGQTGRTLITSDIGNYTAHVTFTAPSGGICYSESDMISINIENAYDIEAAGNIDNIVACETPSGTELRVNQVGSSATPDTYEWYQGNVIISGANTSSYFATQSGIYKVVAKSFLPTGLCSDEVSFNVNIIPDDKPIITSDSQTSFCNGNSVFLRLVNGVANANVTYQWYKDNAEISGATTALYEATETGSYKIRQTVSQASPFVSCITESDPIDVSVSPNPSGSLTATPTGITCTGNPVSISFSLDAGYSPAPTDTYQWMLDGIDIYGASGLLNSPNISYDALLEGTYELRLITDYCESKSSSVYVDFEIIEKPIIQTTYNDLDCTSGNFTSITLSLSQTYSSYEWIFNGTPVGNSATYIIDDVAKVGTYTVNVSNTVCSVISDPVNINLNQLIVISDKYTLCNSELANIKVDDGSLTADTYTWEEKVSGVWQPFSGTVVSPDAIAAPAGEYRVTATYSTTGSSTCNPAISIISEPIIINQDTEIETLSIEELNITNTCNNYIGTANAPLLRAKINNSGIDLTDSEMLSKYTFEWLDATNTVIQNEKQPSFAPTESGTYTVRVTSINNDCIKTATANALTFTTAPTPSITTPSGCNDGTIVFINNTDETTISGSNGSDVVYTWDFGNGTNTTTPGKQPVNVPFYNTIGPKIISVTATVTKADNSSNCNSKTIQFNYYYPGPAVNGTLSLTSNTMGNNGGFCEKENGDPNPINALFTPAAATGLATPPTYSYKWEVYYNSVLEPMPIPNVNNPQIVLSSKNGAITQYTIKVIVSTPDGCSFEQDDQVTINPVDDLYFVMPSSYCTSDQAVLLDELVQPIPNGEPGTMFTGPGVTMEANGKYYFTPSAAGVTTGVPHTIEYNYISTEGCASLMTYVNVDVVQSPNVVITDITPAGTDICSSSTLEASGADSYIWYYKSPIASEFTSLMTGNSTIDVTESGTYRVEGISINGDCKAISNEITITKDTAPLAKFINPDSCPSGTSVTFDASASTSSNSIATYQWTFKYRNGSPIETIETITTTNPIFSYSNFTFIDTYKVELVVIDNNGCYSAITAKEYQFKGYAPTADFIVDQENCQLSEVVFNDNSTTGSIGDIISYEWIVRNKNNPSEVYYRSGNQMSITFPENQSMVTYTVDYTVTTDGFCSNSISKEIEVYPNAISNFDVPDKCYETSDTFTNTSVIPAGATASYRWLWDGTEFSTSQNALVSDGLLIDATLGAKQVTLEIEFALPSGKICGSSLTKTYYYRDVAPTANFQVLPTDQECNNTEISFIADNGFDYYFWSVTDNSGNDISAMLGLDNNNSQILYFPNQNVEITYNVSLSVQNVEGCRSSITTETITIYPIPVIDFSVPDMCSTDLPFSLSATISNGVNAGLPNYITNAPEKTSGVPVIENNMFYPDRTSSGTWEVTCFFDNQGYNKDCTGEKTVTTTISTVSSTITVSPLTASVCENETVTLTASASADILGYKWIEASEPDVILSFESTFTTSKPGNYIAKGFTSDACEAVSTEAVVSSSGANFSANFSYDGLCSTTEGVEFIAIENINPTEWTWNFGDQTSDLVTQQPNAKHKYFSFGTYTVTLKAKDLLTGCIKESIQSVTYIGDSPNTTFTMTNSGGSICPSQSVSFEDKTTTGVLYREWIIIDKTAADNNPANPPEDYRVYIPGLTNEKSATVYFPSLNQDVTYSIKLRVVGNSGNECETITEPQLITIKSSEDVSLSMPITEYCITDNSSITLSSGTPSGGTYHWVINGNEGAAISSFIPSALGAGEHILRYKYTSASGYSCNTSYDDNIITVLNAPSPEIFISKGNATNCNNGEVILEIQGYTECQWYKDNTILTGETSSVLVVTQPGEYYATVISNDSAKCSGESQKQRIDFVADPQITVNYQDGCIDPTIATQFDAEVIYNPIFGGTVEYLWDFGEPASGSANNSTLQNPTFNFAWNGANTTTGQKNVTLTITAIGDEGPGCETIYPVLFNLQGEIPNAEFIIEGLSSGGTCSNQIITLRNTTQTVFSVVNNFNWTVLINGAPSSINLPNAGVVELSLTDEFINSTVTIQLTVETEQGCVSEVYEESFEVKQSTPVEFVLEPSICHNDAPITMNATPIGGIYTSASDGINGNTFDPKLAGEGTHIILYSYTDPISGCVSQAEQEIIVEASPLALITYNQLAGCAGQVILTEVYSINNSNGNNYQWLVNGNDIPNAIFGSYEPLSSGTYSVRVTNAEGCSETSTSVDVVISLSPQPMFAEPDGCQVDAIQFQNMTTPIDGMPMTYIWDFGEDGAVSTKENPKFTYKTPGEKRVILRATIQGGCYADYERTIYVSGKPTANFITKSPEPLCSSNTLVFEDASVLSMGTVKYWKWEAFYANGSPIPITTPNNQSVFKFMMPKISAEQTITVKLTVGTSSSCSSTVEKTFVVVPGPEVTLSSFEDMCLYDEPLTLTGGLPIDGNGGKGVYSGKGVKNGVFYPHEAGIGSHTISYTFTSGSCIAVAESTIYVAEAPGLQCKDYYVSEGDNVTLDIGITGSVAGVTYNWEPAIGLDDPTSLNPTVINPIEDIVYTLTATTPEGCETICSVKIIIIVNLIIPNIITPNGDGINDTWVIGNIEKYPNTTISIYNRYGQEVYSAKGSNGAWDGSYKGGTLPPGTYYYVIDTKQKQLPKVSGSITIAF